MSLADTVSTAARNAWALTLGDGLEEPRPTPSTVLWDEPHRLLRRYDRPADAPAVDDAAVLLVPPLAAPAFCFDLRPDQSVARFLLDTGRHPYLIDYGEIGFADRRMGFEDWIDDILPAAIGRASADRDGAPVDLIGWSLGGVLALLTAAADAALPIRSITAVGAPLDYDRMIGVPQMRALARFTRGMGTSTLVRAAGGVPAALTRIGYRVTSWERELRRPLFIATNITDAETLGRMQTIDRFQAQLPGYPGRLYNQLWSRFMLANDIGRGVVRLGEHEIALADVTVPVLLVGGPTDVITPAAAVRHGTVTLTGAPEIRYETAPGSHLGILTGPSARDTTWTYLEKFLRDQR
ncbi:alpha/beta hydrolase [Nocardia terpenica]|uniref:alpha/beta fold hydrolase n=1 Tax=Nocardia terpenica TaxID=455432 RepID=UPI00189531D8|nr:alpha/beta fold hydrolase [Nocardia terpenica]MBF6063210.1 alpha/beta hydrolase [Nocardia terpenica]MBF6105766.1 alpha/beta hydrolase [Nocardia terpenica]MBF6113650.1 alpha/beta hydrolase [Nocardia terpenica]MBF6119507.1 alpha/beta hydrolase [Nocardia terpenica]MBF6151918.1 alpha/beta hydrolase [Nocardia terpenica]